MIGETDVRSRNARERIAKRYGVTGNLYPPTEDVTDWDLFVRHKKRGGSLNFEEYVARAALNRKMLIRREYIPRYRVPKDDGLRMEPKNVIAKINRILAAQGIRKANP